MSVLFRKVPPLTSDPACGRCLSISGASLHELSYHQVRNNSIPAKGVYLATHGYMFAWAQVAPGAVIMEIDKKPTHTLEQAEVRRCPCVGLLCVVVLLVILYVVTFLLLAVWFVAPMPVVCVCARAP